MNIELCRVTVQDAQQLWEMQVKSFHQLLDKYQDYEKLGYCKLDKQETVNDKMTLVFYEK